MMMVMMMIIIITIITVWCVFYACGSDNVVLSMNGLLQSGLCVCVCVFLLPIVSNVGFFLLGMLWRVVLRKFYIVCCSIFASRCIFPSFPPLLSLILLLIFGRVNTSTALTFFFLLFFFKNKNNLSDSRQ
ncbi:hypothetical protein, unlikely [Trypanosoma brucei gambiense DAL972]|uniref:Uncharacterized protein n=1 Tax=Trypanosoma brucei gambiense (strain MHOM/CI/86/DAL972) TaxID=679716 RepID=C9ZLS6_TRYB9|nr:hypothetical protein, unlikely [Trypanosoma brucei gambiense DAL972]CBH10351.1 hypothetical protein, unlikely [Trypanosoma brucei gambiense DAL972]|eukprot:XP_011772641.1 hypothetical protein, unlikely [Trypanosoma brucei gambiense DAL972]